MSYELNHASVLALRQVVQDTCEFESAERSSLLQELATVECAGVVEHLSQLASIAERHSQHAVASALRHVVHLCVTEKEYGGLEIHNRGFDELDSRTLSELEFLIKAWITAFKTQAKVVGLRDAEPVRNSSRLAMNMTEKILAHHAISIPRAGGVVVGDFVRVSIDWVIASELSWVGMKQSIAATDIQLRAWRNDRFWLVADHTVDPRTKGDAQVERLMVGVETAKKDLMMTENQGANYTILHTEFVRERAEPGMLVIGSDSHTCSAGAVSTLAIGLGAGDTMAALLTGETWFRVPETIRINLTGEIAWYIRGKDVILSILGRLKRNTCAANRVVEFGGPAAASLSCDARFAICNMCTELGAITGLFVPDEVTQSYVQSRKHGMYRSESTFFYPDEGAVYAEVIDVDLREVESFVAIHPSPDLVFPVKDCVGESFDGCFIGACTTTEEDLILAALVLRAGLQQGLKLSEGKRIVVAGSLPIARNLRDMGLLDIFTKCGFEQPAPGCSMCLGIAADIAEPGSRWLSSQNRNFKNRMGKGAINHICSAATVAASSFSMKLTDPCELLHRVSQETYENFLALCNPARLRSLDNIPERIAKPVYAEPNLRASAEICKETDGTTASPSGTAESIIKSKAYRMGDYIDTDAIIPAPACVSCTTDQELGSHCFEHADPDFREHVRSGFEIVIGGAAFGCGSSREEAARALKGIGVRCIIAKSFSYIFGRNAPNVGLLAITVDDPAFHEAAQHGRHVRVDTTARALHVAGQTFPFVIENAELELIADGGLAGSMSKSQKVKRAKTSAQAFEPNVRRLRTKNSREDLRW